MAITFENKEFLYENANIPDKNKIKDSDINALKNGVNTNESNIGNLSSLNTTDKSSIVNAINELVEQNTYSTSETIIGTWENKPLYRKIVEINGLPNNTSTAYDTNISNGSLCSFKAYGKLTSGDANILQFPYISPYASTGNVALNVKNDASKVNITTQTDRTGASAYVIIEYTKTTD